MYGAVNWINDNPVLDGMPIFEDLQKCLDYIDNEESLHKNVGIIYEDVNNIDYRWTVIRLKKY